MELGSRLLCPRKDMPGSIWRPGYWQRRHVLYTSMWLFIILLLALEFSFSTVFSISPIGFMLLFKVVWMYMEVWLLKALTEKMVALPFECGLQTIQYVMTLGATSFLAFIYANIVELGVMIFMRVAVHTMKFKVLSSHTIRGLLPTPRCPPLACDAMRVSGTAHPQVQGGAAEGCKYGVARAGQHTGARGHRHHVRHALAHVPLLRRHPRLNNLADHHRCAVRLLRARCSRHTSS